jgi:hypothetical protein
LSNSTTARLTKRTRSPLRAAAQIFTIVAPGGASPESSALAEALRE